MANAVKLWYIKFKLFHKMPEALSGGVKLKAKKPQKKKYKVKSKKKFKYNHEIMGVLVFALGILILLSFYFDHSVGIFGDFIRDTLIGLVGIPAFIIPPLVVLYSILIIFKKDDRNIQQRAVYTIIMIVLVSSLIQTGFYKREDYINFSPIKSIVKFYEDGINLKGGGILGGIISMPFLLVFQPLGTIIILTALSIVNIILLTNISIANFIRNIKALLLSKYKAKNSGQTMENEEYDAESISFKPEIVENGGNLGLEFKSRPKVIDFKIEKTSRELKEKTNSILNQKNSQENMALTESDSVRFIMKDLKEKRQKGKSKSSAGIEKEMALYEKHSKDYRYPPLNLLNGDVETEIDLKTFKSKAIESARKLEETLNSFGVEAKVINISRGPAVTRYELQPSAGVKVSKIVNLADDIALNLASSGVRIEAPIPGKAAIGIEVPNKEVSLVLLKEVINTQEFEKHPSRLAFAIGRDISGDCVIADISKMPHLLIAGATGSGKSVCINTLIVGLLYKSTPNEVKLLMIDPKVVELGVYNGIPHLLIPVVTDPKKAAGALNWAVQEMINRYKLFADKGVRDINGYNDVLGKNGSEGILPHIVVIIDELADLMMVAPNEVEDAICRLAQMARAAGMHLVIATQRPSVDVITGVIKANIPSRISFSVSSQVDSRTILDMAGAEKLLGKGDMLYYPVGRQKPIRVQGAFVSEKEVEKVVEFLKSQGNTEYDNEIIEEINNENEPAENDSGDNDELLPRAIDMVMETGQASVSLIQRKFKVGYARAARIIDQMEARGIIGGYEGSKPRQILITKQQWQELRMTDENH